jgi:hypothetical protein
MPESILVEEPIGFPIFKPIAFNDGNLSLVLILIQSLSSSGSADRTCSINSDVSVWSIISGWFLTNTHLTPLSTRYLINSTICNVFLPILDNSLAIRVSPFFKLLTTSNFISSGVALVDRYNTIHSVILNGALLAQFRIVFSLTFYLLVYLCFSWSVIHLFKFSFLPYQGR